MAKQKVSPENPKQPPLASGTIDYDLAVAVATSQALVVEHKVTVFLNSNRNYCCLIFCTLNSPIKLLNFAV